MGKIGPGCLVLVVGPSGAGKDTLIDRAKAALAGNANFVFPRRVVTRRPSAFEEHESLTPAEFAASRAAGSYALAWNAHGLDYGVPCTLDASIAAGRTAVCNVSRQIIALARERYANVRVIFIEAPADVLAARLRRRGREPDVGGRIARRDAEFSAREADVIIDNGGDLETAVAAFLAAIREGTGHE